MQREAPVQLELRDPLEIWALQEQRGGLGPQGGQDGQDQLDRPAWLAFLQIRAQLDQQGILVEQVPLELPDPLELLGPQQIRAQQGEQGGLEQPELLDPWVLWELLDFKVQLDPRVPGD